MDKEVEEKLPEGWTIEDTPESELPPGWKFEEDRNPLKEAAGKFYAGEKSPEELKNMTLEERLKFKEDLKTEKEYLQSKGFTKGALSGATLGLSENIEALKPQEGEELTGLGEFVGATLPLSQMLNFTTKAAGTLAAKSPFFKKQIQSMLNLTGVAATGVAYESGKKIAKEHELPTGDDVINWGTEWALLDGAIRAVGLSGRFVKGLLSKSKQTGKGQYAVLQDVMNKAREEGVDFTQPEKASAKALEILEREVQPTEQALMQQNDREVKQLNKPKANIIEADTTSAAQEALAKPAVTPKDLSSKKISDEPVNKLTKNIYDTSQPYQPNVGNFMQEAEELERTAIQSQISKVGERAASEQELGNAIRGDIETNLKAAKEEYAPFYDKAEEAAQGILHHPERTGRVAGDALLKLERLKTKPPNYQAVINALEDILTDAGYLVQREGKNGKGAIELIVQDRDVLVSDSIELGRRVNNLINYEIIDPNVKNALKPVARAVKQDVRAGLAADSEALTAYELAEKEHGRVAQMFDRDSIYKMRQTEAGERIAKMVDSPTAFEDLKGVLSPKQLQQVEREILEKLNAQTHEKAKKTLKEFSKHLSNQNRRLAEQIVESKNPFNPSAKKRAIQQSVLEDLSTALSTGARPDKTLNLWKTSKGQSLIRDTLKNSPNKAEVLSYLEKQSFQDMVSSIISKDTGKIDLKLLNRFMKDTATVNNIRMIGGEDAVNFFKNLDGHIKQLETNLKLLDHLPKKAEVERGKELLKAKAAQKPKEVKKAHEILKPKEKADKEALEAKRHRGQNILQRMANKDFPIQAKTKKWQDLFTETLGLSPKAALSVFTFMKLGLPKAVISVVGYKIFSKLVTNPRLRNAFRNAAKKKTDPLAFMIAFDNFGRALEETGDNQQ